MWRFEGTGQSADGAVPPVPNSALLVDSIIEFSPRTEEISADIFLQCFSFACILDMLGFS